MKRLVAVILGLFSNGGKVFLVTTTLSSNVKMYWVIGVISFLVHFVLMKKFNILVSFFFLPDEPSKIGRCAGQERFLCLPRKLGMLSRSLWP